MRPAMQRVLVLVLFVGCVQATPQVPADAPVAQATFTTDVYYTGIVPPYATPEDCEASSPNPIECHLELGFCADGRAGFSNFDLPEQGVYHLEGTRAIATMNGNANTIILDTQTGVATNAMVDTYVLDTVGRWSTLQFDAGITCAP
jgi:hypothetical protein